MGISFFRRTNTYGYYFLGTVITGTIVYCLAQLS